jgi:CheY-like chemotaxis protein
MASPGRPRILVVDDDLTIRSTFANILDGEGYEVAVVPDGNAAVQVAARQRFDAVLLDLFMPGMDGITALRHLRHLVPEAAIVIMSAYVEPEREAEAFRLGAAAVLAKPPDLDELLGYFRALTHRSQPLA